MRNVEAKSIRCDLEAKAVEYVGNFTVDAKRILEWCSQKEQMVEGSSSSPMTGVHTAL